MVDVLVTSSSVTAEIVIDNDDGDDDDDEDDEDDEMRRMRRRMMTGDDVDADDVSQSGKQHARRVHK